MNMLRLKKLIRQFPSSGGIFSTCRRGPLSGWAVAAAGIGSARCRYDHLDLVDEGWMGGKHAQYGMANRATARPAKARCMSLKAPWNRSSGTKAIPQA